MVHTCSALVYLLFTGTVRERTTKDNGDWVVRDRPSDDRADLAARKTGSYSRGDAIFESGYGHII